MTKKTAAPDAPEKQEGVSAALPAGLAGLGTGALAYGLLRRRRLSDNPALRALQEAAKDKTVEFATDNPMGARMRSHIFGAKDLSEDVADAARRGERLERPGAAVMHHSYDTARRVQGDVNVNAGALPNAMTDKGHFANIMGQVAPEAIPETATLRDMLRRFGGDMEKVKAHFGERGFLIKPRTGSLGKVEDFVSETTDARARHYQEAMKYPEQFVIQEKIPIQREFRVHTVNGVPFTATHRQAPIPQGMLDAYNAASKKMGLGEGNFAHVPVMGKSRKDLMAFVEQSQSGLNTKGKGQGGGPIGDTEHFHQALDVAQLPDGSFKLIESNPVPGTLMNPLTARKLKGQIEGRMTRPEAALGAMAAGGAAAGATAGGIAGYNELNKKEANIIERMRDTGRLLFTGRSRLHHGTSEDIARNIRENGLIARGSRGISDALPTDGESLGDLQGDRIFLTRNPANADMYARQQAGVEVMDKAVEGVPADGIFEPLREQADAVRGAMRDADRVGGLKRMVIDALDDKMGPGPADPFMQMRGQVALGRDVGGDVVSVEMPWHKLRDIESNQVEPGVVHELDPMIGMQEESLAKLTGKERYGLGGELFKDVFTTEQSISPEYIVGGKGHQGVTGQEVLEHAKNVARSPVQFAKELGRQLTGQEHRPSTIMANAPNTPSSKPSDYGVYYADTVLPAATVALGGTAALGGGAYALNEHMKEQETDALKVASAIVHKVAAADGKRYRNRVSLIICDKKGRVLVDMDEGRPNLPGGGTENGKVNEAAKREALEEVGYDVGEVSAVGVSPVLFTFPEEFAKKQKAKGRTHDGWRNYVRMARASKKNDKIYNVEGDGKKKIKFMPIDKLIAHYATRAETDGNEWAIMDRQTLSALQKVKELNSRSHQ